MNLDRSALKTRAKQQLGGHIFESNWVNALLFSTFASAIVFIGTTLLSFMPFLGMFVISGPVQYSVCKMYTGAARGRIQKLDLKEFKSGFRDDFGGNFILSFLSNIIPCLWALIPLAGPFIAIYKFYSYAMCFYIKADHPEYNWKRCLKESNAMMTGHRFEFWFLQFSFIGWVIISSWTAGLGFYWLTPYEQMTYANYYVALRAQFEVAGGPRQFDAEFGAPAPYGQPPMGGPRPPMNGQPPMGGPRPPMNGQPPMGGPRPPMNGQRPVPPPQYQRPANVPPQNPAPVTPPRNDSDKG